MQQAKHWGQSENEAFCFTLGTCLAPVKFPNVLKAPDDPPHKFEMISNIKSPRLSSSKVADRYMMQRVQGSSFRSPTDDTCISWELTLVHWHRVGSLVRRPEFNFRSSIGI